MKKSKEIIWKKLKFSKEINRFKGTWSYMPCVALHVRCLLALLTICKDTILCTNLKMFPEEESYNSIF